MKKQTLSLAFWAFFALFAFKNENAEACGYGFWSDCGTRAYFKINDTPDSFAVSSCSYGFQLDGLDLGDIWSFRLDRVRAQTWESCTNAVKNTDFLYRIYEDGQPAPAFSQWAMNLDSITTQGAYRTRHRSLKPNLELLDGLATGKYYVLELLIRAQVDTTADGAVDRDFFSYPNGQTVQVRFRKSTAAADPFSVVLLRKQDNPCFGDSLGVASVYAYGIGQPFQYNWENDYHFYAQYNLTADDWSISVVNSNGYEKVKTIAIGQPTQQKRAFEKAICKGETFFFEGFDFPDAGHFKFRKAAPNGCDSLIEFDLKILDPAVDLADLPDSLTLDCGHSSLQICATSATADFVWASATQNLSTQNCVTFGDIDGLFVTAFEPVGQGFCSASHFIKIVSDTSKPSILIEKTSKCDGTALVSAQKDASVSVAWSFPNSGMEPLLVPVGQHSATATGPNGCETTAFFEVFEAINFTLEASPSIIGQNDGTAFLKNWTGGKGQLEAVWSNDSTSVSIQNLSGPAWFSVTVSDEEGCSKTDSVFVDAVVSTRFLETEKWLLAPIPTFDFLEISNTQLIENERITFKIMAADGRVLKKTEAQKWMEKMRLEVGSLPSGVYFLSIETGGKRAVERFLKM